MDATHPFATDVTRTIKKACSKTGIRYIRLSRNTKTFLDKARKLSGLEDNLILYFTGFSRSAGNILKEQNDKSKEHNEDMLKNLAAKAKEDNEYQVDKEDSAEGGGTNP